MDDRGGTTPSPRARLRGVVRRAKEVASVDDIRDGGRRGGSALASGLFDPWYHGLQTGGEQSPADALDHWVREGAAAGVLPHPLIDVEATGLAAADVVAAVLDGSARLFPVRPLLDDLALVALAPDVVDHPGGPAAAYLQHARAGAPVPLLGKWSWRRFVRLREQQSAALTAILAAGVLDRPYYEAQVGRSFVDDRSAVWHFLETGEPAALSISPLYERAWYRSRAGVRNPMTAMHLLRTGQLLGAAGPHFDGATYLRREPSAAEHPGGPLGHFVAYADAETPTVPEPGSGVEPVAWGDLRALLVETATVIGQQEQALRPPPSALARWHLAAARPVVDDEQVAAARVAIVTDSAGWGRELPEDLATVLAQRGVPWTLRVAVDAGSTPSSAMVDLALDPRVELVPTSHAAHNARLDDVLAQTDEAWTVLWQPRQAWDPDLLAGLTSAAAPERLPHAVVVDEADGTWRTALTGGASRGRGLGRSPAGVLFPTQRLRDRQRSAGGDDTGPSVLPVDGLDMTLVPFVGVRGSGLVDEGDAGDGTWLRLGTDPDEGIADVPGPRVPGRVSVVVVGRGDRHRTRRAVDRALDRAAAEGEPVPDLEVVVVDDGSDREIASILTACWAADPRVRVDRVASPSSHASAVNRAVARSTGEVVVLLDADSEAGPGWLAPLLEAIGRPDVLAAQALLLTADDTVRSAGLVSAGDHVVPVHLLASHPVEDVPDGVLVEPDAVSWAGLAVRAEVLASAGGFDELCSDLADVDLCLRLAEARPGRFVTVTASRVARRARTPLATPDEADQLRLLRRWGHRMPVVRAALWEHTGLELDGFRAGPALPDSGRRASVRPSLRRPPRTVAAGPGAGLPSLRWAVKIAAQGGPSGDEWGDTYFADDLVRGLRAWGQEAFVDRRGAHVRPGSDHLDDVTLTLRGRWPAVSQPGATNVLWVISHPDEVPVDELMQGFDLVYSAGRAWAEQASVASSREVRTLLQATDAARFTPRGESLEGLGTLFVGRTRKVLRPVVRDALEVGADLTIFGDGWDEFIDPSHVRADHLANDLVPAAYRGARIVLNDHWSDMARLGFYSNRLFDAVAAGARVVSDPVDGLEDVLGPSARTYGTTDELRALLDPASTAWPSADVVAAGAARVAAEHSFTARARTLLADVLDARGTTHDVRDR